MKQGTKKELHKKLQIQLISSQLSALRRELREALHAYEARLEIQLAEVASQISALRALKTFPRDRVDQIEKVIVLLRERRLKPEKGRRKDLRKIENLINDLHAELLR